MKFGTPGAASPWHVVFVRSAQPRIDRGWDPVDVIDYLAKKAVCISDLTVTSISDARSLLTGLSGSPLIWPVCYTIGSDVDGPRLATLLAELDLPYVGVGDRGLRFSSKIAMKGALAGGPIQTPRFYPVAADTVHDIPFSPPYLMKCEYSCNSEGVAVVRDRSVARSVWQHLSEEYGQRIFAEQWARQREYTVAYVPRDSGPWIAPIEIVVTSGCDHIDAQAKSMNAALSFRRANSEVAARLARLTADLVAYLSIDGHFRVDILEDSDGSLQVIDMNFLPQLHLHGPESSYFVIALSQALGISPRGAVEAILEYSTARARFVGGGS